MELLLRIIVRNISMEYFSGIFQEKTWKKFVESGQLCTLAPEQLLSVLCLKFPLGESSSKKKNQ